MFGQPDIKFKREGKSDLKITNDHLQKVVSNLKNDIKDLTGFFSEGKLSLPDVNVEVDGIGSIAFPPSKVCIKKLISISTKARFGKRNQTVLDETVRNTNEIPKEKLTVSIKQNSLDKMLTKMSQKLQLPEGSILTPHLHNMLIYEKGQFFDLHQDSEKMDNMIGTLVIILPSAHIGGNLVIQHGKKKHTFVSENVSASGIKCIAFYADCMHKIEKIRDGYRIALTYKLVLSGKPSVVVDVSKGLKDAIKAFFSQTDCENRLLKLVYLLNYDYTKHSLQWGKLKGCDSTNSYALLAAAKELDLVPHLALVNVSQSWWAFEDDYRRGTIPVECSEDGCHISLESLVDENNENLPFGSNKVKDNEICWTKDTDSFEPASSETGGFTGNEGITVDYVYERASVVLYPRSNQIPMEFSLTFDRAFNKLCKMTKIPGSEIEIIKTIKEAQGGVESVFSIGKDVYLTGLENIALYIKDKDVAMAMLSDLKWPVLDCFNGKGLFKFQSQYGIPWIMDVLNKWKSSPRESYSYSYSNLIPDIDNLTREMLNSGCDMKVIDLVLDEEFDKFEIRKPWKGFTTFDILPISRIVQLFKACVAMDSVTRLKKFVEFIKSKTEEHPVSSLKALYENLEKEIPASYFAHLKALKPNLQSNEAVSVEASTKGKASHPTKKRKM